MKPFALSLTITPYGKYCGNCPHSVDDFCGIWPEDVREYVSNIDGDEDHDDYMRVPECVEAEKRAKERKGA